ncbi:hypothetical protein ACFFR3_42035 [Nonomuraea salmonea]|uniref:Helix-turn-helix domain-containing protein n=1 Tax=Nonomuraea salmonea TaxID=46181 RepID=A0ABV5P0M2_9ACTN
MTRNDTIRTPRGGPRGRHARPMAPDPLQEFARGLRELRASAGGTSLRSMRRRTGHPVAELSAAASGDALPTLKTTLAYVTACGGDRAEWTRKWHVLNALLQVGDTDRAYETVHYPRPTPHHRPPQPLPAVGNPASGPAVAEGVPVPPADAGARSAAEPPPARKRRIRPWVVVAIVAQLAVPGALLVYQHQASTAVAAAGGRDVAPAAEAGRASESRASESRASEGRAPEGQASEGWASEGQAAEGRSPGGRASESSSPESDKARTVKPAFLAVAGPSCPRDARRSVRIDGLPGRDGWKDARAPGYTGAGCSDGFLFSELTYDPAAQTHPRNVFQWRFTTGLDGQHQCFVGVSIPQTGFAGQRVWYTVKDGFDQDARTVAEFTLDQRMRRGKWVAAPTPVVIGTGLAMVQITDTGMGNTSGDQAVVAGPVRLACR